MRLGFGIRRDETCGAASYYQIGILEVRDETCGGIILDDERSVHMEFGSTAERAAVALDGERCDPRDERRAQPTVRPW
jgi:hypothetical protein|tara:strand:- start:278 stop:511 length:234 start_codon:yes stop_codon:yes gene_type:complete